MLHARCLLRQVSPVIYVSEDVPDERARIVVQGQSRDDGSTATLIIIHEENRSWTIHGLGVAGVALGKTDMVAVAEAILARARQGMRDE
jgi:hypothetical protein